MKKTMEDGRRLNYCYISRAAPTSMHVKRKNKENKRIKRRAGGKISKGVK
jgi:hypothetical protein